MEPSTTAYVRVRQLAKLTGLPEKWLLKEAKEGRIPYLEIWGRRFFRTEEVRRVLDARSRQRLTAQV